MTVRARAIDGFAAVLRELRESAGNPSFREMSGRSRAISHTTLHEAAQGNRLPSWSTTAEFVKACGGDPAAYRERWDRASDAVRSVVAEPTDPQTQPDLQAASHAGPASEVHDLVADDLLDPRPRTGRRRRLRGPRYLLPAGAVVALLGAAGVTSVTVSGSGAQTPATPTASPTVRIAAADCPVHRPGPAAAPPAHAGDAAAFISDITLPDCSHVGRGKVVVKTWRFKNVGTVPWAGYSLHRVDLPERSDECQTITDVPIATTPPGRSVDISTEVTTPRSPGFCMVRFKLVDAAGALAFPGNRPVTFQIIVD